MSLYYAIINRRKPDESLEEFVKRFEKEIYSEGRSVKVSGEFFTFKGKPAYMLVDKETKEEKVVAMRTRILWHNGDKVLEILATKCNADPFEDIVIKKFVGSMKFLPESNNKF